MTVCSTFRSANRRRIGWLLGWTVLLAGIGGCGDSDAAGREEARNRSMQLATHIPPAPKPTGPLKPDEPCATPACHSRMLPGELVHEPVATGKCLTCHEPDAGDHRYPTLAEPIDATCRSCHETGGVLAHQHQALEDPGCLGCHDPHVGQSPGLIRELTVATLCEGCHMKAEHRVVHQPYAFGGCLACHEPHESAFESLLRGGEGSTHCFGCHTDTAEQIASSENLHDGVVYRCDTCHAPHASTVASLLVDRVDRICYPCHEDKHETIASASEHHPPVETGARCMTCHAPHSSNRTGLLRDQQSNVCGQCHRESVLTADGRQLAAVVTEVSDATHAHSPARNDNCAACHTIHGGQRHHLLEAEFPESFYTSFDINRYLLCFQCHDKELVLAERSENLTDFRQGDLNLHYLHVHSDPRGRTCRTCHSIHGSDQPFHMTETVRFEGSDWLMSIGFVGNDNGGSCAPGCHEPMTYDRRIASSPPTTSSSEDPP